MKTQLLQSTVFVLLALGFYTAKAQLNGYSNRIQITLNNTSSQCAVNTQIKLTVNTQNLIAENKMQASGNDIRFAKDCKGLSLYNYWIESGINTASTVIWVKVDSIPAGNTRKLFFFSGNSSAQSLSSIPLTFDFAGSSTDSVASGTAGGVSNCQRGFKFSPKEDILVTKLGKMEPDGNTRYVTLFDQNSQAIIAQQQVSGAADHYAYASLPQPIWLHEGQQYSLQMYQGLNDGYYFGTSSQIDSRLVFYDMRYCNNCTQNTFPTDSLSNYQYGYPDLEFYYRTKVTPEPSVFFDTLATSPLVLSAPNSVCKGQIATLSASGCDGYVWSNNATGSAISVTPSVTTAYTVTGFLMGCTYSAFETVEVNTLPQITVVASNTLLCEGETATLSISGAQNYIWSNGSSTSEIQVKPGTTTSYSVQAFNENGCSALANLMLQVLECTQLKTLQEERTFLNIYPNPATDEFHVVATEGLVLNILNELGQVVRRIELTQENKYDVKVRIEPAGVYLITGNGANGPYSQKIVITH